MRLGHGPRRTVVILWAWTALLSGVALFPDLHEARATRSCPSRLAGARARALRPVPPAAYGSAREQLERAAHPTRRRPTGAPAVRRPGSPPQRASPEADARVGPKPRFALPRNVRNRLRIDSQARFGTGDAAVRTEQGLRWGNGSDSSAAKHPVTSRRSYTGFGERARARPSSSSSTPLLFALFGCWLDGRFGTRPVLHDRVRCCSRRRRDRAAGLLLVPAPRWRREEEGKPWTRSAVQPVERDDRVRHGQARPDARAGRRSSSPASCAAGTAPRARRSRSGSCSSTSCSPRCIIGWAAKISPARSAAPRSAATCSASR